MALYEFLKKAAEEYYKGTPIISDEEFDSLAELSNFNCLDTSNDNNFMLPHRMYSLNKFYVGEDQSPLKKDSLIETPKLDGSAVALVYAFGELSAILTRGDGKRGQNISHLIPAFPAPKNINAKYAVTSILGEVVAPKTISNARNYASGALQLKDVEEFKTRDITFVAYGVKPYLESTYKEDLIKLSKYRFNTVLDENLDIFPQDGRVFRLNDNTEYENIGFTSNNPKGAYALKVRKEGVITKLNNVIWQVGRSGVVAPVAELEPVVIDGANVSKATLHNIQYINALGLEIGCYVEVVRSGDIIPRVVRRVGTC